MQDTGMDREEGATEAAEQGDARSQHNLADMYDTGKGVPTDYKEAAKWYRKAADQGHATAEKIGGGKRI